MGSIMQRESDGLYVATILVPTDNEKIYYSKKSGKNWPRSG